MESGSSLTGTTGEDIYLTGATVEVRQPAQTHGQDCDP
jgi:hypothetical protein